MVKIEVHVAKRLSQETKTSKLFLLNNNSMYNSPLVKFKD